MGAFAVPLGLTAPERGVYLGRLVGASARLGGVLAAMDLKRRRYVGTTSMDAELSMVTANVAGAAPGALFYDPFVGTGSLPLAAAHCGAVVWGSDIDGRAVRGAEPEREPEPEPEPDDGTADRRRRRRRRPKGSSSKNNTDDGDGLRANFAQYGLLPRLADVFSADLTNSPIRRVPPRQLAQHGDAAAAAAAAAAPAQQLRLFDGIICDPPYGVREGLRVLGCRNADKAAVDCRAGQGDVDVRTAGPLLLRPPLLTPRPLLLPLLAPLAEADAPTATPTSSRPSSPTASRPCCTTSSCSRPRRWSTAADWPSGCRRPTTRRRRCRCRRTRVSRWWTSARRRQQMYAMQGV